jgi:hypothetical protein
MWRDYLGYAAALLAVLNGALAMLIARLAPRRSVLRLRLGALALVIAAFAVGTTIYAAWHTGATARREASDRVEVRTRLENLALEGRALLAEIKDPHRALPSRQADQWAQRVEIYLRDHLGERAIARFRRDVPDLYGDDASIAPNRAAYWKAVRNRIVNLDTISAGLAATPLRR